MTPFDLTGRRALITGASRGIGFGIAELMARMGATVVLNDVVGDRLDAAVERLAAAGHKASASAFDVSDEPAVTAAVDRIEREHGPIDILVNNAGNMVRGPLEDIAVADFNRILEVHVTGTFVVSRAVARHMVARGRGKIVNLGSIQSEVGRTNISAYTAAKGAIKILTKSMCAEWGRKGLNVNAIGPGFVATEFTKPLQENNQFSTWVQERVPAGRWATPADIAGAAVFLASPASDYVNGHLLIVDGGLLATP